MATLPAWDTIPDPLANNPRRQYLYTRELGSTPFEDLKNAEEANDWGLECQKAEEKQQRINLWIQDLRAKNPEFFEDPTSALAQPTLAVHNEQEFPPLPPPRPAPTLPQNARKKAAKKTTKASNSPVKENSTTSHEESNSTQNNLGCADDETNLHSPARNSASSTARSPKDANTTLNDAPQQQIETYAWKISTQIRPITPSMSTANPSTDESTNVASPSAIETKAPINSPWNRLLKP